MYVAFMLNQWKGGVNEMWLSSRLQWLKNQPWILSILSWFCQDNKKRLAAMWGCLPGHESVKRFHRWCCFLSKRKALRSSNLNLKSRFYINPPTAHWNCEQTCPHYTGSICILALINMISHVRGIKVLCLLVPGSCPWHQTPSSWRASPDQQDILMGRSLPWEIEGLYWPVRKDVETVRYSM